MSDSVKKTTTSEAFVKTRDYFLGQSLKPSNNVPDLLAENRKVAVELAEQVMSFLDVIAKYFGIPTMDLAMAALPEVSLQLEADGVRERAAARTYLDLRGSVPLADICKGTYAYPVPTLHCVAEEILRRDRFARYSPHDPLLQRIFGKPNRDDGGSAPQEDDPDEKVNDEAEKDSELETDGEGAPPDR